VRAVTIITTLPSGTVTLTVASISGKPIAMEAFFTPSGGLTLSAAAARLGYSNFDWQQTITNWPNRDLFDSKGNALAPVPSQHAAFLDPPTGGYSYSPCGTTSNAAAEANPFYYAPPGRPNISPNDCFFLPNNENNQPNTLRFGDLPMDHLLTAAQIAAGNIPMFTTDLVGILPNGSASPPLLQWTWNTTYNGSTGGAVNGSRSANSPFDPCNIIDICPEGEICTGGVTITSITVPTPEPSAFSILASSVLAMLGFGAARARRKRSTNALVPA
jgi:hypothetical protein